MTFKSLHSSLLSIKPVEMIINTVGPLARETDVDSRGDRAKSGSNRQNTGPTGDSVKKPLQS